MTMRAPKRIKLQLQHRTPSPDSDNAPPPSILFRNTQLASPGGSRKASTTYLPAPGSPRATRHREEYQWNEELPPTPSSPGDIPSSPGGIDIEEYPFLDPAYIHQCELDDPVRRRRRRTTASDHPMLEWIPQRDFFLAEMLRHESCGDFRDPVCYRCNLRVAEHRCLDCYGDQLLCGECTRASHKFNPLHRIQIWNGDFFERTSLKALGLRIQLGHRDGAICILPVPAFNNDFVVLDDHGVHEVSLDFCGCGHAQPLTTQILRYGWYPATVTQPKTAATFRLLERFQILTFESKTSAYEFYYSLARETNNTSTYLVKDRYIAWMRMVRQWRHLVMLKRTGRGHDPLGVNSTSLGECAVACPACPQPGKNLPADWKSAPEDKKWLYRLFLGIDANFRLKRKDVSKESADPSLSQGWSYFVEESRFKEHLAEHIHMPVDRSTCNKHHAVKDANTREAKGLAASGAGTVDCIRHNMKRPLAVGDLQKGEKYINMDYLFFSSLEGSELEELVVSYDIACQWSVKIWERMVQYSRRLHFDQNGRKVVFLVPKFHLPAHIEKCQTSFSFNLTPKVGRTDGEAPERGWADINRVATSTREMGPGSRRDTLDDHFGDWNWKKIVSFGPTLLRKLKDAVPERSDQVYAFEEMTTTLPPASVVTWTTAIELWESDNSQVNPFVVTQKTMTQHDVRLALANKEAEDIAAGIAQDLHATITASMMIAMGMEHEQSQVRLRRDRAQISPISATTLQLVKLKERDNALRRAVTTWSKVQELYMPVAAVQRERDDELADSDVPEPNAEDIPLYLPSSIPEARRRYVHESLFAFEFQLREAQAYEALDELRYHLRYRAYQWNFKKRNVIGQSAQTRAQNLIARVESSVQASASKYKAARDTMAILSKLSKIKSNWRSILKPLAKEDLRHLSEKGENESDGKKTISWIWVVQGVTEKAGEENAGLQEALRIEWCKARARAKRWSEEVDLLLEEMRRICAFLEWQAGSWDRLAYRQGVPEDVQRDGLAAYAKKQASIKREMRGRFTEQWRHAVEYAQLGMDAESSDAIMAGPDSATTGN